jgi:hypothetical protein
MREHVGILTGKGRELLERSRTESDRPEQRFYAGLVKPRELAHDAQLYRLFQTERERLEAERGTVTRVVLDYELKADYHRYVHERHLAGVNAIDARRTFAEEHGLPFAGEDGMGSRGKRGGQNARTESETGSAAAQLLPTTPEH